MKIAQKTHGSRFGFSLVEVMLSLLILGFVILGLVWSQQQKWQMLDRGNQYKVAIRQIEQRVENIRIKALSDDAVPANATSGWTTTNGVSMKQSVGTAYDAFGNAMTNAKALTIWATWPGGRDTIKIVTTVAKDF